MAGRKLMELLKTNTLKKVKEGDAGMRILEKVRAFSLPYS